MVKSVAVIGVGAMGGPIARQIRSGGFQLTVCDRSEEALGRFDDGSTVITQTPADCSSADLVLILVATADQVREVVLGPNGITAGLGPEHSPLIGVMSTVGRETVVEMKDTLAERGIHLIDAPISGGPVRAEEGSLAVILGGDDPDVAAARPVMECLGPMVFHCGPVGAAQTIKIANNIIGVLNVLLVAEVYRLVVDHGLSLSDATPILDASTGRNWLSATPGEAASSFAAFTATRGAFDGLMAIMRKDVALGLDLRSGSDGSFPIIEGIASLFDALGDETFDNWRAVGAVASA
jgi:3-hydroxyisobutyrate dehydrogenase